MKQWSVGTLSMGVALILFGVVLFLSQISGKQAFVVLIDWWPIVFILLGLELLIYLVVSRASESIVKYDIFSIFFVGFICFSSLGFAVLTSTGVIQELRYAVSSVEQSVALPDISELVSTEVKRVVILNNSYSNILVDQTASDTVHVFGSYHYTAHDGGEDAKRSAPNGLISVKTVGDTMYVSINKPPQRIGIRSDRPNLQVTVVLPDQVQVDVTGNHKLL
jgi:hypothetical protein